MDQVVLDIRWRLSRFHRQLSNRLGISFQEVDQVFSRHDVGPKMSTNQTIAFSTPFLNDFDTLACSRCPLSNEPWMTPPRMSQK